MRVSPDRDRWHVALAIPRIDAWALTDDHIREEFDRIRQDPRTAATDGSREKIERANYLNLAAQMKSFVQSRPFDLENLKRKSRQCRELCEFIDRSFHGSSCRPPPPSGFDPPSIALLPLFRATHSTNGRLSEK